MKVSTTYGKTLNKGQILAVHKAAKKQKDFPLANEFRNKFIPPTTVGKMKVHFRTSVLWEKYAFVEF